MGCYVSNGIAVRFKIFPRNNYDIFKEKDKILEALNEFVDVSRYEVQEYEEGIELKINTDFVNENLHELIKEIHPILNCKRYLLANLYFNSDKDIDIDDNFNSTNYPINLKIYDENYKYESEYEKTLLGKFYLDSDDDRIKEHSLYFPVERFLISNREIRKMVKIEVDLIMLWLNPDKISIEDDTELLYLLNKFSRNYFHNSLSKNLLFFIND